MLHTAPIGAFVGGSISEGKEGGHEGGGGEEGGGEEGGIPDATGISDATPAPPPSTARIPEGEGEGGIPDAPPPSTARPLSLPRRAVPEGHNLQGGEMAGGTLEGVAPVEPRNLEGGGDKAGLEGVISRVASERDAGVNPHLAGSRPSSSLPQGRTSNRHVQG